ncbi:MAG: ATP-binding protein [Cellulomonadaceae bacterium]
MQHALMIEPELTAIAPARRWAAERLRASGVTGHTLDVLVLLVSEVVTNAIVHARPPVTLHLSLSSGTVRVEVGDFAREVPVVKRPSPSADGGRGVALIDTLASRWGTTLQPESGALKSVWFEIAL